MSIDAIDFSIEASEPESLPTKPPISYPAVVSYVLVILPVKLLLEILELSTFETNPPIPRSPAIIPSE
ncbi:Uncharacterised protein [Streptococcus pneumoniae]|nr:Uncharacterised protein [Streptococcus pneumoniae]CAG5951200.1 Uncharacterised protein [Streptococcus pneumoniae]CAG5954064.1 Uncharacterised protein [Streptococcus pneumoniae]